MPGMIAIRAAESEDLEALGRCFRESIEGLTGDHYDAGQRSAWASASADASAWVSRLGELEVLLAEQGGTVQGFLAYRPDGLVDLLYVRPAFARTGVATRLHECAARRLRDAGCRALHTAASLVAEPFFARLGYEVVGREVVERAGVGLPRARMQLRLAPRGGAPSLTRPGP